MTEPPDPNDEPEPGGHDDEAPAVKSSANMGTTADSHQAETAENSEDKPGDTATADTPDDTATDKLLGERAR